MQVGDIIDFIHSCDKKDLYYIRREAQYRINDMNSTVKEQKPEPQWALDVAEDIYRLGKRNFDFIGDVQPSKWAADIRKIYSVENQHPEKIKNIAIWSQKNDFWKRQIRSGQALRRHFEKLIIAQESEKTDKKKASGYYCNKHPENFVPKGKVCGYCR